MISAPIPEGARSVTPSRFTYVKVKYDDSLDAFGDVEIDATLQTHHITAGVSFRF